MKNFDAKLKELRLQKNMSQIQLAEIFHVRNTTVSAWETGVNEPDQETLIRLAKFFEVSVDYMLGLED